MKSLQLLTQSCKSFIVLLHNLIEQLCYVVKLVSSLKTKVLQRFCQCLVVNTRVVSSCTWCTNRASWNGRTWNWWTNWTPEANRIKALKTSVKFSEKREHTRNNKKTTQTIVTSQNFFFAVLFSPTFVKQEVPVLFPLVVLYRCFHPPRICQSLYFFCLSPSLTKSISFRSDHSL